MVNYSHIIDINNDKKEMVVMAELMTWVEVAREMYPTASEDQLLAIAADYMRCLDGIAE